MKYAVAGAALLAGAEGVSALVNMNRAPEMGEESQMVTLEDWGPALLRVDMVEATMDPRSRFPASLITWLVIAALVTLVICIPFV